MARRGRPASETYQPVCYSSSHLSSEAVDLEDEDDHSPIFSLSKSSMDVVMAPGSPHKRDPTWTRMDLRRSHSTNTHSEPNPATHKKLHDRQSSLTGQNVDVHSPAVLGERWVSDRQRWSQCSSSTHSRSSTPETIVWIDGTSRPSSLTTDTINSPAGDSPTSQPTSSPTDTSPFISPLQTPTSPPEDFLTSTFTNLSPKQRNDMSSPSLSPLLSPLQAHASSPVTSICPTLPQFTRTEEGGFLENNLFSFTFPSPLQSSVSLADGGAEADHGCLADDVIEDGGARSPVQMFSYMTLNSPTKKQESGASVCKLELLRQPGQVCPTGRRWRSLLVSSMSDSQLGDCCRCSLNTREDFTKVEAFKEEATMTSQLELVDAATQTISPVGSCWHLVRNMSTSNMGSPSILGSPPGSRLNLKSSVGSHSNLVSPSSSMFPVSSGEEEERPGDDQTSSLLTSSHGMQRRRSCLKIQKEESDELWRRSSTKQVQWDENGMTWDIHGASVDPEVLSTAIRKHLEDHNSPQPARRSSKKKKAPKPPLITNVVTAIAPELGPSVAITLPTCAMEGESEDTPDGFGELGGFGGVKKEETVESSGRKSRAEGDKAEAEEEEAHRGEGATDPRSPSRGSGQGRKKSMIRSLRRPGWCGGSKKAYD